MKLTKLFTMQRELDSFIQKNRDSERQMYFKKKGCTSRRTCRISK